MKTLIHIFTTAIFLALSFNTVAFETETPGTVNLVSEWINEGSVKKLQQMPSGGLGVSCSSRDGTIDCFCDGGCWRREDSCGCTANVIGIENDELLLDGLE